VCSSHDGPSIGALREGVGVLLVWILIIFADVSAGGLWRGCVFRFEVYCVVLCCLGSVVLLKAWEGKWEVGRRRDRAPKNVRETLTGRLQKDDKNLTNLM
jgi:hypothetical protein